MMVDVVRCTWCLHDLKKPFSKRGPEPSIFWCMRQAIRHQELSLEACVRVRQECPFRERARGSVEHMSEPNLSLGLAVQWPCGTIMES